MRGLLTQTKAASSRRTPNPAVALAALLSENAHLCAGHNISFLRFAKIRTDAEVVSHKLLLRAGIIRQLSAGIYSYLPIGQRVALKVMQIVRQEMNRIGGQEFYLPALHPAELWQESGTLERDWRRHVSPERSQRARTCVSA